MPPFFSVAPIGHGALFRDHLFFDLGQARTFAFVQNNDVFPGIDEAEILFGDFVNVGFGSVVFVVFEFLEVFLAKFLIFFFKIRDVLIDLITLINGNRESVNHVSHQYEARNDDDFCDVVGLGIRFVGNGEFSLSFA